MDAMHKLLEAIGRIGSGKIIVVVEGGDEAKAVEGLSGMVEEAIVKPSGADILRGMSGGAVKTGTTKAPMFERVCKGGVTISRRELIALSDISNEVVVEFFERYMEVRKSLGEDTSPRKANIITIRILSTLFTELVGELSPVYFKLVASMVATMSIMSGLSAKEVEEECLGQLPFEAFLCKDGKLLAQQVCQFHKEVRKALVEAAAGSAYSVIGCVPRGEGR
jgi:hypothetical protein